MSQNSKRSSRILHVKMQKMLERKNNLEKLEQIHLFKYQQQQKRKHYREFQKKVMLLNSDETKQCNLLNDANIPPQLNNQQQQQTRTENGFRQSNASFSPSILSQNKVNLIKQIRNRQNAGLKDDITNELYQKESIPFQTNYKTQTSFKAIDNIDIIQQYEKKQKFRQLEPKKYHQKQQSLLSFPSSARNSTSSFLNKQSQDCKDNSSKQIQNLDNITINEKFLEEMMNDLNIKSKEKMKEWIETNLDYFLHLFQLCNCYRCYCGDCSCKFIMQQSKLLCGSQQLPLISSYQKFYNPKEFIQSPQFIYSNSLNTVSQLKNPPQIIDNTTNQTQFTQFEHQNYEELPLRHNKKINNLNLFNSRHLNNLTSYNSPRQDILQYRPYDHYQTLNLPFQGCSNYTHSFRYTKNKAEESSFSRNKFSRPPIPNYLQFFSNKSQYDSLLLEKDKELRQMEKKLFSNKAEQFKQLQKQQEINDVIFRGTFISTAKKDFTKQNGKICAGQININNNALKELLFKAIDKNQETSQT